MFNTPIVGNAFTSIAANNLFRDKVIGGQYVRNGTYDFSWLSTARALVAPRMSEEDGCFEIQCRRATYNSTSYTNVDYMASAISNISNVDVGSTRNSLDIVDVVPRDGHASEAMDQIEMFAEEALKKFNSNWSKLDVITEFFRKAFKVLCYVNPVKKQTIIFGENLDFKKTHYLQICILTALPWYFNPAAGDTVSPDEMALLMSLQEKDGGKYLSALQKIADGMDFEERYLQEALDGFEKYFETGRLSRLAAEITSINDDIASYYDSICDLKRRLREKEALRFGMMENMSRKGNQPEVYAFFRAHKGVLVLDSSENGEVRYHVNTYLSNYNEDFLAQAIKDRNSFIYRLVPTKYDKDAVQKALEKIFIDQEIRIRMCAGYTINSNGNFAGIRHHDFRGDEATRAPNTHVNNHRCLGGNEDVIFEYMDRFDFIGAIEQSIGSAGSINFLETVTSHPFLEDCFGHNVDERPVFELPDGTLMKFSEVINYVFYPNTTTTTSQTITI